VKIAVIGTGYVGLVTGACLAEIGHHITCVDQQASRVDAVNNGRVPFHEAGLEDLLKAGLKAERLLATGDLAGAVAKADVIMIVVGTPFGGAEIDLSQVTTAATAIGRAMRDATQYQVVVVKSTVVPGTTEGPVRFHVEQGLGQGLPAFGLCMNPEFLREGTAVEDFRQSDRIVLGCVDQRTETVMREMYRGLTSPVLVTNPRNAEMIKYTANSLLATLVSFSNEIAALCESTPGLDVDQVMDGVHLDRRLTFRDGTKRTPCEMTAFLRAGNGFGGSCLPKDVNALRAFAKQNKVTTPLLDSVMTVNDTRSEQVVAMLARIIGPLAGRTIAVLGLAFKAGTDDLRDSPALALVQCLLAADAKLRAYDSVAGAAARLVLGTKVEIVETIDAAVQSADAVVVATAWPEFRGLDWKAVTAAMTAPVIIDARNGLRGVAMPDGVRYHPIGVAPPAPPKAPSVARRALPKNDTPVPAFLRRA
jgi:UDPglucose 6-dehydrogenase